MSIQSTVELSRERAEARLTDKIEQEKRKFIEAYVHTLTDEEIEDELDEEFYNYRIVK